MKRILLVITVIYLLLAPQIFSQNPKLLFTSADLATIKTKYNSQSGVFPFNGFKGLIEDLKWTGPSPSPSQGMADYDRAKAQYAKMLAFRYCAMNTTDVQYANYAFDYLYTKYVSDNYIYETNNYARWMTNGLALIDYCIAYDLLAGSGYFEAQNKTAEKN